MAKDGEAMRKKSTPKVLKPPTRVPRFRTHAQEEKFWLSHDFDDVMEASSDQVVYEPQATRRARAHVYRVRLDDEEMATLQALARRRGVTASVVLRELVRAARGPRVNPA
jgi:Ribbon-helix-helix protein, copG family